VPAYPALGMRDVIVPIVGTQRLICTICPVAVNQARRSSHAGSMYPCDGVPGVYCLGIGVWRGSYRSSLVLQTDVGRVASGRRLPLTLCGGATVDPPGGSVLDGR
jgi:hypothetical protein